MKFREDCPEVALPPEPIVTRWCTWLKAAEYYCDNFASVKSVIDTFKANEAESIERAQKLFADGSVKTDLVFIKNNFSSLISATIKLETQGLALNESVETIISIRDALNSMRKKEFGQKMQAVLKRNPGFDQIIEINNILNNCIEPSDPFVSNLSTTELALFKYCPTTSTDVERSFSVYGNILTEKRRNFLFENLKHHMIVNCNAEK